MIAVIVAGGRGSRIATSFPDIPKPMIEICNHPVLEHEIACLHNQGYNDIFLTVGYKADVIKNYFGNGSNFGVNIEYYTEKKPLGNAGALYEIKNDLSEDFFLLNADSLFDIDFDGFLKFHKMKNGLASIFTHPNSHPFDSGLIICDGENCVTSWLAKEDLRPQWYKNRVNAGLHILSRELLNIRPDIEKVDLDRNILKPLAGTGNLFCYDSPEYVKDMGTPERLMSVTSDFEAGIVKQKNLNNKQKAIFLDRDGTINKYVGFLTDINDFELLHDVGKAIKLINSSGYLAVVVTNQPVIARGDVSIDELNMIHNKMETLLGNEGAYVDAIYYCPHHPHNGFEGEIPELKIECNCRKPKPGMLLKAAEDLNIDLSSSWMIGDSEIDVEAGRSAGCQTMLINEGGLYKAVSNILEP